jgi:hypothetical protein
MMEEPFLFEMRKTKRTDEAMKIAKVNNEDENNIKNRLPWDNESVFK